ncbi:LysM peptidoglycan-binding domain-containing protein [Nocardiopsis potens]|uniref:LysM peptidoglycan-binding domain-containing protein n=1 Tax=Nocardiopsis potens TaxID=1246458 RepID=UPI000348E9DA|nr:LysM peptidoglycan-binding domain-containing protein [Nocardiopsis potens]
MPPGPALYDWAVEIPEWHRSPAAPPALAGLPELLAAPGGGPGARLRLTVRGRVVLVSLLCAVATGMLSLLFMTSAAAGASGAGAAAGAFFGAGVPPTVVVRDGDTLWGIAERVRPGDDTRRTVHEIVELNGLAGTELEPGQRLRIPGG